MTMPSMLYTEATATPVPVVLTIGWAALAVICDLRTRRIPNRLTFPAVALGLVANLTLGGLNGLAKSAVGTLLGAALLFVPFVMGGMGAGDVKMLAAVGALGGPIFVFRTFYYGSMAGGLIASILIMWRTRLFSDLAHGTLKTSGKQVFPYGMAIFAGAVAASVLS